MYEKILQKLKEQRQKATNVTDRTLEDLAKSLETIITTDELLSSADLSPAIKSIDGNINNYTAQQVEEVKKTFKSKEPEAQKQPEQPAQKTEDMPAWAKALIDQNQTLLEQMNGIKSEKVTLSRSQVLSEKIKETPDIFRNATLKGFNRMKFETDEDFDSYLTEIEESAKEAKQVALENGLNISSPKSEIRKPDPDEVTPAMQKAIEKVTAKSEIQGKF